MEDSIQVVAREGNKARGGSICFLLSLFWQLSALFRVGRPAFQQGDKKEDDPCTKQDMPEAGYSENRRIRPGGQRLGMRLHDAANQQYEAGQYQADVINQKKAWPIF